jgi:spore maturation protein CgeB
MNEFEKNGGLITVFDSRELVERLIYLLGSEEQRHKMGAAALRTIEKNRGATQKLTKLLEAHVSRIVA